MTKKTCYIAGYEHVQVSNDIYEMIEHLDWDIAWHIEEKPDVMLFIGGSDINPRIYGQTPHSLCGPVNKVRDGLEIYEYHMGQLLTRPPVNIGICRGAQLLNCLNGGSLFQHVTEHTQAHVMKLLLDKSTYMVTSTHHQQMVFPEERHRNANPAVLLGVAGHKAPVKAGGYEYADKDVDIEVMWYPQTKSLCFQPHPEYDLKKQTFEVFQKLVDKYCFPEKKEVA